MCSKRVDGHVPEVGSQRPEVVSGNHFVGVTRGQILSLANFNESDSLGNL